MLTWDKPEKKMSVEDWKGISADSTPPGVYTPNMSDEDAKKWRAKLTGQRSGCPQVEIRSSKGGSQLLCIVSIDKKIKYKPTRWRPFDECNVRISTNGPLMFSFEDWAELNAAIDEAKIKLLEIQNPE